MVLRGGRRGEENLYTGGRAKQRWVEGDLSPASVVQPFKGRLCQRSAFTLKLEGLGVISVGFERGERFGQTARNGLGSASLL